MTRDTVPRGATASNGTIVRLIVSGALDDAQHALTTRLHEDPGDAAALMLSGRLAGARGDPERERRMIAAAVEHAPANGEYRALLARSLMRAQDVDAALAEVERALACTPLNDLALDALAGVLAHVGRHREAATLLKRAVSAGSRNAAVYFNLGNNLKFVGDVAGARSALERALDIAPRFHKARAALSALGAIGPDQNHLPALEAAIAAEPDARAAIHLRHAAARELEALGRYDAAWAQLAAGKAALRRATGQDPWGEIASIERLARLIPTLPAPPAAAAPATGPILVVGMPRSGTTLVDRIVSNHSDVASIGESLYFAQLLKLATGSTSRGLLDGPVLDAFEGGTELASLGERYVKRGRVTSGTARFLDKFHLNVMLAGHLMRAMPSAQLLCVVRNPLDTIVGNYRQLFEFESTLYSYSLDVHATTAFYIAFRRLAAAWEAWAPQRFRIVYYERLARAPDAEAQPLFAFCGLSWQEGVTDITRNTASVSTASALQVRDVIHTRSIGSWRRYGPHLAAAQEQLRTAGLADD